MGEGENRSAIGDEWPSSNLDHSTSGIYQTDGQSSSRTQITTYPRAGVGKTGPY